MDQETEGVVSVGQDEIFRPQSPGRTLGGWAAGRRDPQDGADGGAACL